jgi:ATP-binding cassette subfamily F protein uup
VFLGSGEDKKPRHVCGYLKHFLFDPKNARDKVSTLSGGQQNRLMLAKVLANPGNVLILDEPTNDLDMDTLDMLQEVLAEYPGTLLLVSHDRDFLDRTVTEIIAFEGDGVIESNIGGYTDYLEAKKKLLPPKAVKQVAATLVTDAPAVKKDNSKMSYKYKHELENLPGRIEALEKEINELRELLNDSGLYMSDPERFDKATRRFPKAQHELETAELRWLELEEVREAKA